MSFFEVYQTADTIFATPNFYLSFFLSFCLIYILDSILYQIKKCWKGSLTDDLKVAIEENRETDIDYLNNLYLKTLKKNQDLLAGDG